MFCRSYNDFFQTLANPTNQSIIQELLKRPMNVTQLTEKTKLEQSHISHSLKKLYECKIVDVKRDGKQRIYSLNKDTIIPIIEIVDKHAKKMCPRCLKV
ncbi:TPA: winged helix-turn-helix transcriptional regulator [Candidatus Woesearchaeota archaeon]|nr:winged helix-turn-helix transcriptional regulator [Candidatus Woesearchaeota archaeon]HIH31182.1 winged helix-turn-helix transcriptional regulator [Candidatus Woesearchaeota archaeon]HIJ13122.1 winged helix-turn-helix transcriptional regulator [Candidatus Woesearchaeota archaeon]